MSPLTCLCFPSAFHLPHSESQGPCKFQPTPPDLPVSLHGSELTILCFFLPGPPPPPYCYLSGPVCPFSGPWTSSPHVSATFYPIFYHRHPPAHFLFPSGLSRNGLLSGKTFLTTLPKIAYLHHHGSLNTYLALLFCGLRLLPSDTSCTCSHFFWVIL